MLVGRSAACFVWVWTMLERAVTALAPFGARGEGAVAASLEQLPQTVPVHVGRREVGGAEQPRERLPC